MKRLLLSVLLATCAACASSPEHPPSLSEADYPFELVEPDALPDGLFWQQRIKASFRGREVSFEAILQKEGPELLVVGLTPVGAKAFVLRQIGSEFSFEALTDHELPFPPRFMLIDIQRCFFPFAPAPETDGERTIQVGGETLREEWRAGKLRSRSFEGRPSPYETPIRVRYDYSMESPEAVPFATLENTWFDYVLEITTADEGS